MTKQIVREDGTVEQRDEVALAPRSTAQAQIATPPDRNPTPQRIFSYFLQQAGAKLVKQGGVEQSSFAAISEMMVTAMLTGRIPTNLHLEDEAGEPLLLDATDWLRLAKMVMDHMDGPATREIRVSGNAEDPIQVQQAVQFYIPENGRRRLSREEEARQLVEGAETDAEYTVVED